MASLDDMNLLMDSLCRGRRIPFSIRRICALSNTMTVMDEAEAYLLGEERAIFKGIRSPKRRAEFYAGRIAAKDVLASAPFMIPRHLTEIGRDEMGAPRIAGRPDLYLSISHSGSFAVAVASFYRVGIDLELDEVRPRSFVEHFLSRGERTTLLTLLPGERQRVINQLWTRKEAACKFGGWGARLSFRDVDCSRSYTTIGENHICLSSGARGGFVASIAYESDGCHG